MEVPVYLFTGFLEAGKTRFIQETLEDKRFNSGERTLLLVCEEGIEEYEPDQFAAPNVYMSVLESENEFNSDNLSELLKKNKCKRVVIEYNGMWMLDRLFEQMPEGWVVYQEFMFADAATFLNYNANMRGLVVDKLKSCELVVFNRVTDKTDIMELHKIVRGVSRRPDIAYEDIKGDVQYDDIEDPLPFDIEAPIIEIGDENYAIWYRDLSEEMSKYQGKVVKYKAKAVVKKGRLPSNTFIVGRQLMTCCVEDITFAGLICEYIGDPPVKNGEWITITAKIEIKKHRAYGKKGPVLTVISTEPAEPPQQEVATFY